MRDNSEHEAEAANRDARHAFALIERDDVADRLGTTERHVRRLTTEGHLAYVRVGGKVRYRPSDIDAYIERQARGPRWPATKHAPEPQIVQSGVLDFAAGGGRP